MRIRQLKVKKFRNLRDFEINFDDQSINVLLGQNGAAKSNLIEFLAHIFAELELELDPSTEHPYYLRYECRTREIEIDARYTNIEIINIKIDGEPITYRRFVHKSRKDYQDYLPTNVIVYYSGLSDRLANVCNPVKEQYYSGLTGDLNPRLRRIFLTDGSHSPLILFTFLADQSEWAQKFLRERLGIVDINSVRLHLSRPKQMRRKIDPIPEGRDYRYWYAGGTILDTLRGLQKHSIPLREVSLIESTKKSSKESTTQPELQNLHLYFNQLLPPSMLLAPSEAQSSYDGVTTSFDPPSFARPKDLFQRLDDLRIAGYGLDVHFKLQLDKVREPVSLTHLSEGEQQLLTVIGLLRFTQDNDTLFLLDEPDTHLNPQWSYEYRKMLADAMTSGEPLLDGSAMDSSQIIMATHDPVLIAGLVRNNVRIMERREVKKAAETEAPDEVERIIRAYTPEEDPRGMGIARILTSPLFGLRSILDEDTLKDLETKRELAFKENRTPEENEELRKLVRKLRDVDMTTIIEDPLYTYFVSAVIKHPDYLRIKDKLFLTPDEFADLTRISTSVREEMLQEATEAES